MQYNVAATRDGCAEVRMIVDFFDCRFTETFAGGSGVAQGSLSALRLSVNQTQATEKPQG
jgi:hypothetical protein